jgi:hypothetical protein
MHTDKQISPYTELRMNKKWIIHKERKWSIKTRDKNSPNKSYAIHPNSFLMLGVNNDWFSKKDDPWTKAYILKSFDRFYPNNSLKTKIRILLVTEPKLHVNKLSLDWTQASYSRDQTSRRIKVAGTPSQNFFTQTSGVNYSEWLLESVCPKTAATSRFQYSAFLQVMRRLFIQTPKSAFFLAAGGLAGVEARFALYRPTD